MFLIHVLTTETPIKINGLKTATEVIPPIEASRLKLRHQSLNKVTICSIVSLPTFKAISKLLTAINMILDILCYE